MSNKSPLNKHSIHRKGPTSTSKTLTYPDPRISLALSAPNATHRLDSNSERVKKSAPGHRIPIDCSAGVCDETRNAHAAEGHR